MLSTHLEAELKSLFKDRGTVVWNNSNSISVFLRSDAHYRTWSIEFLHYFNGLVGHGWNYAVNESGNLLHVFPKEGYRL